MSIMILGRNHFYKETKVGSNLLEEHRKNPAKNSIKTILPFKAASVFSKRPAALMIISVFVLFNIYIPLGTVNSLYFAPYMTEVLKLGKSTVSILGGVYSAAMLLIFVFVIPLGGRLKNTSLMISGLIIQGISLFFLTVIPAGSLSAAILSIIAYAVGFGIFRPYIDTILAEVTEGNDRAGIYGIINTATSVMTALVGFASGSMYLYNPRLIYIASIVILAMCAVILGIYLRFERKKPVSAGISLDA